MFKNYIIVAIRNLFRQKIYSMINIIGFAIGLAVCLAISYFLYEDLTFDGFHKDAENIYRVLTEDNKEDGTGITYAITSGPLMESLTEGIPEIISSTRCVSWGLLRLERKDEILDPDIDNNFRTRTLVADENFFDVFDFKILRTIDNEPLQNPSGIYLTQKKAEQIYGTTDPLGKAVEIPGIENAYIAGIIENIPRKSHLIFNCVIPLKLEMNPIWWDSWTNIALNGYIKVVPGTDMNSLIDKMIPYTAEKGFAKAWKPTLQPLLKIHLFSENLRFDNNNNGKVERSTIYTLAIIGILVLLVAAINFVNLSSARASRRAREVGIRKVVGSRKHQLVIQFLGEALIVTAIAMILAFVLFELALPYLNQILRREVSVNIVENPVHLLILIGSIFTIGICSGIFPAFILSNFKPLNVLKGNFTTGKSGIVLRRILVVGQFAVSISLISSMLIIRSQLQYLNKVDLGYSKENVMIVERQENDKFDVFRERLASLPNVTAYGQSNSFPGGTLTKYEVSLEGVEKGKPGLFDQLVVDDGFITTMEIEMLYGRNFSPELQTDVTEGVIINESAAKIMGTGNPVGKTLTIHTETRDVQNRKILGVVKDFNFSTARRSVNPMFILCYRDEYAYTLIKLNENNVSAGLNEVKELYQGLHPNLNYRFEYFEDIFNNQFREEQNLANSIGVFSLLAILISSLGLFGLSSFTIQMRTKEICIRKVLGASIKSITYLLVKDFTKWVIIANGLALIITYYPMKKWLENFIYHENPNLLAFVAAGLVVIVVSILTVSFQSIKAAFGNPAEKIRHE